LRVIAIAIAIIRVIVHVLGWHIRPSCSRLSVAYAGARRRHFRLTSVTLPPTLVGYSRAFIRGARY
jgi:hypothetical protein